MRFSASPLQAPADSQPSKAPSRRDFLTLTTLGMGAVGMGAYCWPLIDSMNPAADVLALASVDVSIAGVEEGQSLTVKWRGKPVFIRRRTPEEIAYAQAQDDQITIDPQPDSQRTIRPEWIVLVGICTHLGCVPLGQKSTDPRGEWQGWFCPCHGSVYDISGRIRKGPAPTNMAVPPYQFISDTVITIG